MNKKSQITIFIIIGIVILLLIILVVSLRSRLAEQPTPENLYAKLVPINQHISTCINQVAQDTLARIGKQGGYLNPQQDTFRLYADEKISYLCYNIPGTERCRNRLLLKQDMEDDISKHINFLLQTCLDVQGFNTRTIEVITPEPWKTSTKIHEATIAITVTYPVIVKSTKTAVQVTNQPDYLATFAIPLGSLYELAQRIVDDEAEKGDFDPFIFQLSSFESKIQKLKPYPDKMYIISQRDNPYIFQFAIEGEAS